MEKLLVILRAISIVVMGLGMIALIYFHIEVISMIWKESYKTYCDSPGQIMGVLQGRLILLVPTAIGAVGWLTTDNAIEKMKRRRVVL